MGLKRIRRKIILVIFTKVLYRWRMTDKGLLFKQTLGHFCVDASCAAVVVGATRGMVAVIQFFVLYNFLAFCMQPLAGILLDKIKKLQSKSYIIASFVLLLCGFIPYLNIWGRVMLVGLGNCLFHTGAGTIILTSSHNKMAPLGIFVSGGAVGLFVGTFFAHNPICHIILALSLLALILLNLNIPRKTKVSAVNIFDGQVAFWLCMCITIRSFMGFAPLSDFTKTPLIILMITMGVFAGKSLGGIFCDKWGIKKVVYVSTIFVMALFLFSFQNPYLWTVVQVIVNLSMPITLYLMYKSMPRYPAFSFGLAASFLVIGLLLSRALLNFNIPPAYFLLLFVINSAIILYSERKLK